MDFILNNRLCSINNICTDHTIGEKSEAVRREQLIS